jgi:hypothetical protein
MMQADQIKTIVEIVNGVAAILAILAAGGWFLYTSQFKQRIQFDVELRALRLQSNPSHTVIELAFTFENKGFVEHRLWNLNASLHSLEDESALTAKPENRELQFTKRLLPSTQLVPKKYGYFFVRPGVRQIITHILAIPADCSVVRVTASFDYRKNGRWPHTIRRVFLVPPAGT